MDLQDQLKNLFPDHIETEPEEVQEVHHVLYIQKEPIICKFEKRKGKATTNVQVYDMTGRLIEQRQAVSKSVEIGSNYPTGIYNVIVNQGDDTKTVRLIKK
jgi:hypothetical protein